MGIKNRVGKFRISRDTILFFSGLGLIIQEAQRNGAERPTLLILYAAMVGLPQFLQRDETAKEDKKDEQPKPESRSKNSDSGSAETSA